MNTDFESTAQLFYLLFFWFTAIYVDLLSPVMAICFWIHKNMKMKRNLSYFLLML